MTIFSNTRKKVQTYLSLFRFARKNKTIKPAFSPGDLVEIINSPRGYGLHNGVIKEKVRYLDYWQIVCTNGETLTVETQYIKKLALPLFDVGFALFDWLVQEEQNNE